MILRFTLAPFEFFVLHTRTRFPFRYGIASMTDVPHLFLRTTVTVTSNSSFGLTAEGLPPKWFTKNPHTTFDQDLPQMLQVIQNAATLAVHIALRPISFFDFWRELYRQQMDWARSLAIAPLLANLGVSLVERAVLDGLCRLSGEPLHRLIATNRLEISLRTLDTQFAEQQPADFLPATPLDTCFVRHTIGLGDPLAPADIPADERLDDGLPQDLESSIRAYGLRYFKVKLSGVPDRDFPRLRNLAQLLERETTGVFFLTLDGNENFQSFGEFRDFWQQASSEPALAALWHRILIVEQPVHRDVALSDSAGAALCAWPDRPMLIIDESDAALADLPRALELGYAGTSHKNCKGIVKGIANACLLAKRRSLGHSVVLTGEDLCNLGPLALLQDLAMTSLFGIEHVERNGHHYYRGLSMLPSEWQNAMLASHGDIYVRRAKNLVSLKIKSGKFQLGSVNGAPFGVFPLLDPSLFSPLEDVCKKAPECHPQSRSGA